MFTRDVVEGRFISYFKECQHCILPEHNDNRVFVSLRTVMLDKPGDK